MIDAYQLRHILQAPRPLGLWIDVLIPNVHVSHAIGYIVTSGADKFR